MVIDPRFSSRLLALTENSLVIVTCFAMSFALWSASVARLILDASVLHCTRAAIPTLLNFASSSFCWMRFPLTCCCAVFLQNADIRLCEPGFTSLSASLPRWNSLALFHFLFQLKLVCSRSGFSMSLLRVIVWALVLQLHNGFLRNFDIFVKLIDITSTRSFQDVCIPLGTFLV